jgi:hypothetical protein
VRERAVHTIKICIDERPELGGGKQAEWLLLGRCSLSRELNKGQLTQKPSHKLLDGYRANLSVSSA